MKIAAGLEMLELDVAVLGQKTIIHPTVIFDESHCLLVDAGMPSNFVDIRSSLDRLEVPLKKLTVIVTHQDLDHIAGLPGLVNNFTGIEVLAHEAEKPYIEGELPLIKVNVERINANFAAFPEEHREKMLAVASDPPKCKIDKTVKDGERLPWCGGIIVIHTPGHSPGHICLYHESSKTLIAGDALTARQGELFGPMPEATLDIEIAINSLKKLTTYDIRNVICYHGGLCQEGLNDRIAQIAGFKE